MRVSVAPSAVFLAFLLSLSISWTTFGRPLGANMEGLTAHALVSMRAFEERGFLRLRGISVMLSGDRDEFPDSSIPKLPVFSNQIFARYPPLWLWPPYFAFRVFKALTQSPLTIGFLEGYHLVIDRLGGALAVFLLGSCLGGIILKRKPGYPAAFGLVLAAVWIFQAPTLFWTQNVYFTDTAVLPSAYLMTFLIIRKLERPRRGWESLALFAVAVWCCGTDYFGWVIAVVGSAILGAARFWKRPRPSGPVLAEWVPLCGALVLVGAIFTIQLLSLGNRFPYLWLRFEQRSWWIDGPWLPWGQSLSFGDFCAKIVEYWRPFTWPVSFLVAEPGPVLLAASGVALASLPFAIGLRRRPDARGLIAAAWALLILCPLLQLLILKIHSATHNYSACKVGIIVALSWLSVPILALELTRGLRVRPAAEAVLLAVCLAVVAINVRSASAAYAGFARPAETGFRDLAEDLNARFNRGEILVSDDLTIGQAGLEPPGGPIRLWYLKRFIYHSDEFADFSRDGLIRSAGKPVVTLFTEPPGEVFSEPSCRGRTEWLPRKFFNRRVLACVSG